MSMDDIDDGMIKFSPSEKEAMDTILLVFNQIHNLNGKKLVANHNELSGAIHVLEAFVTHCACGRLDLFCHTDLWWKAQDDSRPT